MSSVIAIVVQTANTYIRQYCSTQLDQKDLPLSNQLGTLSPFYLLTMALIAPALIIKMKCLKPKGCLPADINENSVTIIVSGVAHPFETNTEKLVLAIITIGG